LLALGQFVAKRRENMAEKFFHYTSLYFNAFLRVLNQLLLTAESVSVRDENQTLRALVLASLLRRLASPSRRFPLEPKLTSPFPRRIV